MLAGVDAAQVLRADELAALGLVVEAFGGGAHVIDLGARKSIGWISTHEWLTAALNGEDIDAVEALVA